MPHNRNMYLGYKKEIWANSERSCLTDPSIAGIGGNILVAPRLQSKLINAIPDQKVKKKHLQSKTDQMQLLSSGPFHWGFINCIHRERRWWQKRWRRFSNSTSKSTSIMMAKRANNIVPPSKQWITVRKGVGMCVMSKCNKMLPASKNNMFRAETSVRGHFVSF